MNEDVMNGTQRPRKTNPMVCNPNSGSTEHLSVWIDEYNVGSEGGSAWMWVGEDMNNMTCIGFTARTRVDATIKVLNHYWKLYEKPISEELARKKAGYY